MSSTFAWQISTSPDVADVARVADGVLAHGRLLAAGGQARPLSCFIRDGSGLVAGGVGRTEFQRLFIATVWVAEPFRSQGLGTGILLRMEEHARQAGCTSATIETLNDRVAVLYGRLGYTALATLHGFVGPLTRHIMSKSFTKPPVKPV